MRRQRTIAEKVTCAGVGLHGGLPAQLTLYPARANTGIVFVRRDVSPPVEIPARASAVISTSHATTLACEGNPELRVKTAEHLLAALYALGIDNLRIEIDAPEVPAMDGSAAAFIDLIRSAGIFIQREARAVLWMRRALQVEDGERSIRIEPAKELSISYAIEFDHPTIGRQELALARMDAEVFERELAGARTFGFVAELRALLGAGLARGGSLENTLALDEEGVLNAGGLRWPDEFVRHKMLDLLGDLSLLGISLRGHVRVERGGHTLHHRLVRRILGTPDAWRVSGGEAHAPGALEGAAQPRRP
ncbi:MAG: UDP-3-O-acyl-N-acetylglucosamine deacetylase [Myxococcota bacterium]